MKIGISTKIFPFWHWIVDVENSDFEAVEINRRTNNLPFFPDWIEKIMPHLKDKDLSFHTGTCRVFTGFGPFTDAEYNMLRAEVFLAKQMGARQVVFHLGRSRLSEDEVSKLQEIVDLAKEKGITLCYESNRGFSADVCLDTLERLPSLHYCLDIGHLNVAVCQGLLGMALDDFLDKVNERTTYVHAHNNNGERDQHLALSSGTADWQSILSKLSNVQKLIIECNDPVEALKSRRDIDLFLNRKL